MKIVSSILGVLVLAGCVTPKSGQWHNNLYERDRKTSMRQYYSRDFNICLSRSIQAATDNLIGADTIEQETDLCMLNGGWFRAS